VIGDLAAGAGLLLTAAAAAAAILLGPSRLRTLAMLVAVALTPVLVFTDQWDTVKVADLRHHPARLAALLVAAALVVAVLTYVFHRRRWLIPLAILATLPFRIPLHSGGDQANLLIPLYLVIAAAVLSTLAPGGQAAPRPAPRSVVWLRRALAAFVVLYAIQTLYSEDFSTGLQNACFFLAPFSIVFALLADLRWDRRLLVLSLGVLATEALAFALIGFYEYHVRELLWNDAVIRSNDFHTYFRVNSLFWDPNVYGRYLALVTVVVTAALLWARSRAVALSLSAAAFVLALGMITTFSQSSFLALLAGLATLAALRWSLRWTLAAGAAAVVLAAVAVLSGGGSLKIDLSTSNRANVESSGRASLISGGADLFSDRPIYGYGSGSFSRAFRKSHGGKAPVSESHTEPITVAAEQGVIGLAAYIALLVAALGVLGRGLRAAMPGLGGTAADRLTAEAVGRAAVFAAFIALLVHTLAYAGFFEDPGTWVLLAVGAALTPAAASAARGDPAVVSGEPASAPAA
jgi:putative inorganic carbon (hco3(-)) transporter